MKLKSKITLLEEFITAVLFVDDADMITEGKEAEEKMQRILEIYNRLYTATGGYIENKKCKYFAWYWRWKQGQKEIKDKNVEIVVNGIKVTSVKSTQSERSLGVYMSPAIVWITQFAKMKEKMMEAMYKLKNTTIVISTA